MKAETLLRRSILQALALEPGVFAMVNNIDQRGKRKGGLGEGSADIICCVWGDFVALEVKLPGEVQRPKQLQWEKDLKRVGGRYYVVTSIGEALAAVMAGRGLGW